MKRWLDAGNAGVFVLFLFGLLWAALGAAACRGGGGTASPSEERCRRLCEASLACEDPSGELHIECFTSCDDLEAINRVNECHDEVDAFYDCIEKHGACADLDVVCEEQQAVYSDCIADPCSTDPERDICL